MKQKRGNFEKRERERDFNSGPEEKKVWRKQK